MRHDGTGTHDPAARHGLEIKIPRLGSPGTLPLRDQVEVAREGIGEPMRSGRPYPSGLLLPCDIRLQATLVKVSKEQLRWGGLHFCRAYLQGQSGKRMPVLKPGVVFMPALLSPFTRPGLRRGWLAPVIGASRRPSFVSTCN